MSDNEHVRAITRWAGAILATLPDEFQEHRRACEDIRSHAEVLATQLAEAEQIIEHERREHRDELIATERQIDYACRYGERDRSMGMPQPRRPTIHERLAEAEARAERLAKAYITIEAVLISKTERAYMKSRSYPRQNWAFETARKEMRQFHRKNAGLNPSDLAPADPEGQP